MPLVLYDSKISDNGLAIIALYILLYLVPDIVGVTRANNYFISIF